MTDRPPLAAVNGTPATPPAPAARWSPIPPKPVRQAVYKWIKDTRRPAGTLAVPAIASTGSLYFTGVIEHADTLMALGLTSLVVLYDSVIALCRTWRSVHTADTAQAGNRDGANRAA
ncbi:hypothetical protein [Streptomyces antibioticus]|uniref:hypothetical protein n=1 Tax=Streptomyces antibioticus TaxID=1890 RepID=UPI0019604C77|nr:hypothetical protein [Streptomyces sp. S9]